MKVRITGANRKVYIINTKHVVAVVEADEQDQKRDCDEALTVIHLTGNWTIQMALTLDAMESLLMNMQK